MTTATPTTPIDTTKVEGRRAVRYESYDALLADVEELAGGDFNTLGNWSYGQILDHIAKSIHAMIDGPGFSMPAPMRFVMRLSMMNKMVHREVPPGFKFPEKVAQHFEPDDLDPPQGVQRLREAIDRVKSTRQRGMHPAFGAIKTDDWDRFQLRHCEMHMSFVVPQ